MAEKTDLIRSTAKGLRCERGGFHIDAWKPCPLVVVTHAHADHARPGHGAYIATPGTAALMRHRIGADIDVRELGYGETIDLGAMRVSLHPAGHVLGSAQVRVEDAQSGDVWVVSGDYKVAPDTTCEPFEIVPCQTFVTETTFGLPIYRWPEDGEIADEISGWWRDNAEKGRTSIILTYSLGKAQRVLSLLDPSIGPIGAHGAVVPLTGIYREQGVELPEIVHANRDTAAELKGKGLIVAPPSVDGSPWTRAFSGPEGVRTGFASGWMAVRGRRRWRSVDRGFVLSDHADWNGLLATVRATGASRVGATHGSADVFARYAREEMGLDAFEMATSFSGEAEGEGG